MDQWEAQHVVSLVFLSYFIRLILQQCILLLAYVLVFQHTCQGIEKLSVSNQADSQLQLQSVSYHPKSIGDGLIQQVEVV